MKNGLLDYFKKYKLGASVIVGIGIMLIPICVFADQIDPSSNIPLYYNPSNGCFGVDNSDPQYKLDVNGDVKVLSGLNVGSASGAGPGVIKLTSIYSDMLIGAGPNNYNLFDLGFGAHPYGGRFLLMMQGVTKVELNAYGASKFSNGLNVAGSVGIGGVTNPQYTLTVSGNVAARNFITSQAVWNDKVFSPTYNLMPLSILESYVKEHKHLPEVAEEKVVLKNGVNIGEFQAQLLQKVEELTLYVIEQDKKNAKLVSTVEALQKENVELKATTTELKQENKEIKTALNELKKK